VKAICLTIPVLVLSVALLRADDTQIKTDPDSTACHGTTVEFVSTPRKSSLWCCTSQGTLTILPLPETTPRRSVRTHWPKRKWANS
jgi:hypothetical protein